MIKFIFLFLVFILMECSASNLTFTQAEKDFIAEKKVLKVGIHKNWMPIKDF